MGPSADKTQCDCVCENQWTGDECEICPPQFAGADCNQCARGDVGDGTTGDCRECTVHDHCNDHAVSTTSDDMSKKCVCICSTGFENGPAGACEKCADGYLGYPNCVACETLAHCSGRAVATSSNAERTSCDCGCRNQWAGGECETCQNKFVQNGDCDSCNVGYISYPTCVQCDVAMHCNNHADVTTSDSTNTACTCRCKNSYSGTTCGECSSEFDSAKDCAECSANHVNYPKCDPCDTTHHCNGRALPTAPNGGVASTDLKTCACTCENKW